MRCAWVAFGDCEPPRSVVTIPTGKRSSGDARFLVVDARCVTSPSTAMDRRAFLGWLP